MISGASTIDGPSADIVSFGNVAMADDGTGGLVYLKRTEGHPHVFAARFSDGKWLPPVRIDVGQQFDSAWPVIGAGEHGRLVVVWAQDFGPNADRLFSSSLDPGARSFQAPIPIDFNIDEDIATYPSLAMNRSGIAYLSYRVLPGGGTASNLPPDYVNSETRIQRYDGSFWTALTFPANRNPNAPNRTPTALNSPKVGIDVQGDGIVAFQEPDDDFIDRIYARRIFGNTLGNPLIVSPQTIDGQRLDGAADAFTLQETGFGDAAVAFRQQPGTAGLLPGTRAMVNTISDAFTTRAAEFSTPRLADGLGDSGPSSPLGPPGVSITSKESLIVTTGIGNSSVAVAGDESRLGASARLDDGNTDTPGDPTVSLGEDGATAYAWKARINGRGAVTMRERRADGVTSDRTISGPRGGPVVDLEQGGSGLGDALIGFQQGGEQFGQIVGASINSPPAVFNVQTPVDFVNDRKLTLAWDPAAHAIGSVTYSVTVDDEGIADAITGTKIPLPALDDGVHVVQVIATDDQGQQTTSRPADLKLDRRAPRARIKRLSGHRLKVTLTDGAKDQTSGVDLSSVHIGWGDRKTSANTQSQTHKYPHGGTYLLAIGAKDAANNRARIRKRVQV